MADQETHTIAAETNQPTQSVADKSTANDEGKTDNQENVSMTTVFHDRNNYNVKHPLQNTWTLWFDNPGKKANINSWAQNLKEVVSISTVEDFWGVYNNVARVNNLDMSSNYHFFKKGVRPEWEDPANANGGKFSIQLPRNRTGDGVNDFWLHMLLAMIGEQYKYEDEICGAVVSVRKVFYRIALWIKTAENREIVNTIGCQMKEFLNVPNNIQVEFTPHGDSATKTSPNRIII
ncbi:translation initiation factor eIF 4e-like domain-containing protein [Phycomyces nitens]|nr:translation initiation factor eIF 4e-like domain-containing protein [Phycomyces nitens]